MTWPRRKDAKIFLEIVIAPSFDDDAYAILAKKKNIRLLSLDFSKKDEPARHELVTVMGSPDAGTGYPEGGLLEVRYRCSANRGATQESDVCLKAVKHVKSNAIVLANDERTLGVGEPAKPD